jgi:UDP-glucose:(heptosyl)LPS alpha-1,3-glucosyltransferase
MRLALTFQRVDPKKGGAETYVADLCHSLVRLGHNVDLYANEWAEAALPAEVRCIRVEISGWTRMGRIRSFAESSEKALAMTEPYDCVVGFINTWHQDVLIPQGGVHAASLEANSRRFPAGWRRSLYVAAKRSNPRSLLYDWIERRQYDPARAVRVVAVSEMVRAQLERFHGVPRDRITVIPNAIDAERLAVANVAATRLKVRQRLGLMATDLVALFVGHNFRLKGLPSLLEALARRKNQDPAARPVHLLVCGGGKIAPFRRMVDRLELNETVHLIGFLDRISDAFHAADFFVSPTYYDPCSLVVFEALACGLPVVTTRCNGAGELITTGREGFVVSAPDCLDELISAINHMTDDSRRQRMVEQARRLGRAQTFDIHVSRMITLFEEVAASKRTALPHGRRTSAARQGH